jgi:hypothetical protein
MAISTESDRQHEQHMAKKAKHSLKGEVIKSSSDGVRSSCQDVKTFSTHLHAIRYPSSLREQPSATRSQNSMEKLRHVFEKHKFRTSVIHSP